ncbi:hypothetical protein KR222_008469, partial [Zaprionus bogoriensis]
ALDVPKWYLGLSDYQEQAINELSADLRDDFEQGTSFRVEKDLCRLGLSPLVGKKKIRTMVQLSRGNDLAFLFFILEGYYTSSHKNGEYTTNEKLLMIAMSKIDLLPTLRELDRILPPPQLSPLDLKRQNKIKAIKPEPLRMGPPKKSTKSPYFQRQPRPKEIVINYTSKPPSHIASFPFWPLDQPPHYGTPADPPWFADYNLNPVARLVKCTVGEAVDKYFNHLNYIRDLEKRARKSRRAAAALETARRSMAEEPTLCVYHQFALTEEQLLKDELTVIARDRVMELMDVTMPYRKLRQRRIVSQLEHDIEVCLHRYAMKMEHTTVQTISKSDCVLCQEQDVTLLTHKPQEREGRILVSDCLQLGHTEAMNKYMGTRLTGGGLRREQIDFNLDNCEDVAQKNIPVASPLETSCEDPSKKKQRISFMLDDIKLKRLRKNRKEERIKIFCEGKQTKKTFFKAPTDHKPYLFKYKRIFKSGQEKPRDVNRVIAKAFIKALKADDGEDEPRTCKQTSEPDISEDNPEKQLMSEVSRCRLTDSCTSTDETSDHSEHSHEDRRADIVDAVVRCAKQIWMKGVNIKRAEMEVKQNLKKVTTDPSVLSYDVDRFDPDDAALMNRMLEDGLRQLRKSQRYVLATLPNAHKLPVLQEWIKRRYGKQYSEEEVQKSIQESLKIFEMINSLQSDPPTADFMGMDHLPMEKENYNYAKAAKALGNKVRTAYYQKLNDIYMSHTTACWYAMGNYLCPGGPPKKVFYAYMSGNTRDIMR